MHRDIKGGNLLLTRKGVLKIADFGLAREFRKANTTHLTTKVVTRWYRAPELLLNITKYTEAIDIWSIGCFLCELFIGSPAFPGKSDLDQLPSIFLKLGLIPLETFPKLDQNAIYKESVTIYTKMKKENPKLVLSIEDQLEYLIANSETESAKKRQTLCKHLDKELISLILKMQWTF